MQSFAFATTSGERSRHALATSAFAIRTPSGSRFFASRVLVTAMARLRSATHRDAGPLLVDTSDRGEVGIRAEASFRDAEHLEHGCARDHGDALRVGLLEAHAHVLEGEPRREAEVERARKHGAREFVLRRAVAAAARVYDLAHEPWVEAGLDAHRDGLRRQHDR